MRVRTGEYVVNFFDRYGGHLKHYDKSVSSYMGSLAVGNQFIEKHEEIDSYRVMRAVYNSLDNLGARYLGSDDTDLSAGVRFAQDAETDITDFV